MSVFAKCERAKRKFTEEGMWADAVYYSKEGNIIEGEKAENADYCVVMCDDKALSADLAKVGKYGAQWSTASKFEISKDRIEDADITINQASCTSKQSTQYRMADLSLLDLVGRRQGKDQPVGNTCKVTELHVHNGHSPASHLHIECNNSAMDTVEALSDMILEANIIGNRMCEEGRFRKKKREMMF